MRGVITYFNYVDIGWNVQTTVILLIINNVHIDTTHTYTHCSIEWFFILHEQEFSNVKIPVQDIVFDAKKLIIIIHDRQ